MNKHLVIIVTTVLAFCGGILLGAKLSKLHERLPEFPEFSAANDGAKPMQAQGAAEGGERRLVARDETTLPKGSSARLRFLRDRFVELGKSKGKLALEEAHALKGRERRQAVEGIVEGWAQADFVACVEWFKSDRQFVTRETRFNLSLELARRAGTENDISKANALLDALPRNSNQQNVCSEYLYCAVKNGQTPDLAILGRIERMSERVNALGGMTKALVEENPQKALEWAQGGCPAEMRNIALSGALSAWVADDGFQPVGQWLSANLKTLSDQQADAAFSSLGNAAEYEDGGKAGDYFSLIQDPGVRDSQYFMRSLLSAGANPEASFSLAAKIGDPKLRQQSMQSSLRALNRVDPALAQKKLQELTVLTSDEKKKLADGLAKKGP